MPCWRYARVHRGQREQRWSDGRPTHQRTVASDDGASAPAPESRPVALKSLIPTLFGGRASTLTAIAPVRSQRDKSAVGTRQCFSQSRRQEAPAERCAVRRTLRAQTRQPACPTERILGLSAPMLSAPLLADALLDALLALLQPSRLPQQPLHLVVRSFPLLGDLRPPPASDAGSAAEPSLCRPSADRSASSGLTVISLITSNTSGTPRAAYAAAFD
jgi:hypothetical protein